MRPDLQKRLIRVSSNVTRLARYHTAESALTRGAMLAALNPLLTEWSAAYKADPKEIPEPPGKLAKLMFTAVGIPGGRLLNSFVGFGSNLKNAKRPLLQYWAKQFAAKGDKLGSRSAAAKWDKLCVRFMQVATLVPGIDKDTMHNLRTSLSTNYLY